MAATKDLSKSSGLGAELTKLAYPAPTRPPFYVHGHPSAAFRVFMRILWVAGTRADRSGPAVRSVASARASEHASAAEQSDRAVLTHGDDGGERIIVAITPTGGVTRAPERLDGPF
jgi:hypothetical protein